jgi:hypothetical protein
VSEDERLFGIGRVLIWLMAPVAAEQLKYGKTVLSDPRRSKKLVAVLAALQGKVGEEDRDKDQVEGSRGGIRLPEEFPQLEADRAALLQWAYFEAAAIVRQYGDLLEDVSDYMRTGTSTVGECAFMIEKQIG